MPEKLSRDDLSYQLFCMEDPAVLPAHKLRASNRLLQGGKQSVGVLIKRLEGASDPLFMHDFLVATGPMNPGAPRKMSVSLKYQIENILYQIIYPEQAPRPELRGEPVIEDKATTSTATHSPAPIQSLAAMKADWENARDQAIGELSPSELGGAYAFIADWQEFWRIHGTKSLADLRTWGRQQVEELWSTNLDNLSGARHLQQPVTVALAADPETPTQDLDEKRKAYARAWLLFEGTQEITSRKAIALKGFDELEKKHPSLSPHLDHLRALLP